MDKLGIGDLRPLPEVIPVAALKTILATPLATMRHFQL